jgi:hypothetical protein
MLQVVFLGVLLVCSGAGAVHSFSRCLQIRAERMNSSPKTEMKIGRLVGERKGKMDVFVFTSCTFIWTVGYILASYF